MLRKETRPRFRVSPELDIGWLVAVHVVARSSQAADPPARHHLSDRRLDLVDDPRVPKVEDDSKAVDAASVRGDTAIPEIDAQQICVRLGQSLAVVLVVAAGLARSDTRITPSPSHRPAIQSRTAARDTPVWREIWEMFSPARWSSRTSDTRWDEYIGSCMRAEGIEPTRSFEPPGLSRCCLPVPARPQGPPILARVGASIGRREPRTSGRCRWAVPGCIPASCGQRCDAWDAEYAGCVKEGPRMCDWGGG